MDPFGFWWTGLNEIFSISFFFAGGLNGGGQILDAKKKLMWKISLKSVHHKPNGSMIHQPGPKVSMTFI